MCGFSECIVEDVTHEAGKLGWFVWRGAQGVIVVRCGCDEILVGLVDIWPHGNAWDGCCCCINPLIVVGADVVGNSVECGQDGLVCHGGEGGEKKIQYVGLNYC